ncbi:cyclin-dependent kinase 4 inhibitor C [Scleropages formosus]|uniref:Cyclin-dependent kinase inhibitor 2C (p18, inhibits CDK4) n=1 Tax=Scleropages formosus TaxID=113540 RepID=A0A8C9W4V7_SCLFO|nr:cyclin-dependent kinase 4 inhibitor C [Scleropages formosus]
MADLTETNKLTSASARGDLREVELMITNGADVNQRNEYGYTALQAMKLGCPDLATALLKANADPNVCDALGLTVTHDAARDGYLDTLRVLLEHGADVNVTDSHGNLPLHLAAREGNLDVVELLLQRTAEPMRPNCEGSTAYDLATSYNRPSVARIIRDHPGINLAQ